MKFHEGASSLKFLIFNVGATHFLVQAGFYELQYLMCACIGVAVLARFTTAFLQQVGVNLQHTNRRLPSKLIARQ
jgi:hypothetical protein